jgi:protein farnesyltransferase subunit beta
MAFFRGFDDLEELGSSSLQFDDESFATATSQEQESVESRVLPLLQRGRASGAVLRRDEHETYISSALEGLSPSHAGLDSSKPWLVYWSLHALDLLAIDINARLANRAVEYLFHCSDKRGGFCGGPQQLPHLAPSYASCLTLAIIARDDAFDRIDRRAMYNLLMSLKHADGSFAMHLDGENDVRATYCALTVASLLNLLTPEVLFFFAKGRMENFAH